MNKKLGFILTFLILITSLTGCQRVYEPISRTEFLLGTIIEVKIFDSNDEKKLGVVFDRIREIEDRMSINIEDSDISKLNKNAGIKPVRVHDDVYYVLEKAKYFTQITNGVFDPTIGPLVKLWAIGTENPKIPSKEEIKSNLIKIDYKDLELMENNFVFLKNKGMIVDLGGIAKGYAADEANRILAEQNINKAIINLGGNIYAKGKKNDESNWGIGIQNPFEIRGNHLGIIAASDQAIVTSGDYERYFEENGVRYHHIFDVKTGYPARNEVASISVVSKYSIDADALSTALFVLGVKDGMKLVEKLEGVEVAYVTRDYKVYFSSGLGDKFILNNNEFTLIED